MTSGIGNKYGQITNKWYKKRFSKTHKTTKVLKKLLSKRRRREIYDNCRAKNDLKCYIKGVIDP